MTLLDSRYNSGIITAIGGDAETHRRLADLGLLNARYEIKARRKSALYIYFVNGGHGFSAVVESRVARLLGTER